MIKQISYLFICFFFITCKSQERKDQNTISTSIEKSDTISIQYYNDGKIKEVLLTEYQNEKMVQLSFFQNGFIELKVINYDSYPKKYSKYSEKGNLIESWTEGDIGGCIAKIDTENFYENGKLKKTIIHSSLGESCSEKILIAEEKEFYPDENNIKSIKYFQESYEGSDICPCGTHQDFDENGKVLKVKEYPECGSGSLNCE